MLILSGYLNIPFIFILIFCSKEKNEMIQFIFIYFYPFSFWKCKSSYRLQLHLKALNLNRKCSFQFGWQSLCFWLGSDTAIAKEAWNLRIDSYLATKCANNKSRCKHFRSTFELFVRREIVHAKTKNSHTFNIIINSNGRCILYLPFISMLFLHSQIGHCSANRLFASIVSIYYKKRTKKKQSSLL